jgi:MoaA/NifB/PqqE/SkfB family radical SAM enzyme
VKKNLDDLKKIGIKVIDFTGGEPLLNKDLPRILTYAKQLGFFVKLATNGFLYPEKAEELKGLPSRIYISFDTTSPEEYKKIRGIDGYQKVLESIDVAKKLQQEICLFFTVTDENIKNISSIVEFCKKNRVIIYIHPCFSYFENKPLAKEHIHTLKKYFWHPYVRMNLPQLEFHYKGGNNICHPACKVGRSTVDIGPDDCLTIPCFHKHLTRVKINGNLYSLFTSNEWTRLFEHAGRYKFCQQCTIDCYFGLSYWDRVGRYFFKQNLSFLKDLLENWRN